MKMFTLHSIESFRRVNIAIEKKSKYLLFVNDDTQYFRNSL